MPDLLFMAIIAAAAGTASWFGVAVIRRWAGRGKSLDIPNERSLHTRPMPRGGGLAVVLVVLAGLWLWALRQPMFPWRALAALTLGGLLIAAVSWRDDLRPVSFWIRLLVHVAGAGIVVAGIGIVGTVGLPCGILCLGWLGLPLTLAWIVGLTNAYNFMDGIDGLAGGQAVVAGAGWALIGWLGGQPAAGAVGLLLAAASLGFLGHNWPPARIFMGDVGSAFLGYMFAGLTVLAAQSDPVFALAGVALVWPFVFDATLTFFRRLSRGEKVWVAHRSHLYQRLVISGLSHGRVSSLYVGLAVLGAALAVALVQGWRSLAAVGAAAMAAAAAALWGWSLRGPANHT